MGEWEEEGGEEAFGGIISRRCVDEGGNGNLKEERAEN